jgi:predicted Zn-dependent protease
MLFMKTVKIMRLDWNHLAVAACCFIISACAATGPKISAEDEKKFKEALLAESKAWQKKQQERIEEVASRLLEATDTQSVIRFVFAASSEQTGARVNLDAANAWTDGSTVWVTRGMIRFLKNDDELAAVLGHEIAHALRGHMRYLWAQNILGMAVTVPAGIYGGQIGGEAAARMVQLATAKFDRDREREADLYGLMWVHRAGFNVDDGKEVFRRIAIEMPGSTERGFLSTHPTAPERFLALDKIAATLKAGQDPLKVFAPKPETEPQTTLEVKKTEEAAAEEDLAKRSSAER